jgi:adenine deaminase
MQYILEGNIVDIINMRIIKGSIEIKNGRIHSITEKNIKTNHYILPGLIDAHIHIESSMLTPVEFARMAVINGTVATVSDPHEIANVLGIKGIKFMIENGKKVPFKFYFGAPSCVPATEFESSGARLGVKETEDLLQMDEIKYLSEMMNFPGVLFEDKEVMAKLALAKKYNKPVDGHAPGIIGKDAKKYIEAGITTDHECFGIEEAKEKIKYGMKVLIREGSAAKNFDELVDLLKDYPDDIMFCSDDKHPDDLEKGHINDLIRRAIHKGFDPLTVIRSCIYNPAKHYKLDAGMLRVGDVADMIIIDNLNDFNIQTTYINGEVVAKKGKSLLSSVKEIVPNKFVAKKLQLEDLKIRAESKKIRVIEALEGQLITNSFEQEAKVENGYVVSDTENDILKIVVLNRYKLSKPAIGFIKNFGISKGAISSTVAHDSHNIIAIGADDESLLKVINLLIESKGGIALTNMDKSLHLPLPVGGIMSDQDGWKVAIDYKNIDKATKDFGCKLKAPFMTLSFMALLVIPELKLSDQGLFDGKNFQFTKVFC